MFARGLFLLIMEDDFLCVQASEVCQRLSVTRRARTLEVGVSLLKAQSNWAGLIIESSVLGIAFQRGLLQVRSVCPSLPCLLLAGEPKGWAETQATEAAGLERADLERDHGIVQLESFARRAFVLELLPDVRVARRVDQLFAELNLTARELQLVAYALGREPRHVVVKRLGVTVNTLKSQVRTLLRKCEANSMTELADRIIRESWLTTDSAADADSWRDARSVVSHHAVR